jgi:transposase
MYCEGHPGLVFQQDGGPGHTFVYPKAYMKARGVVPIFWPPVSPDLSPIKTMWKRIKDILSLLSPEVHRSYERLRIALQMLK